MSQLLAPPRPFDRVRRVVTKVIENPTVLRIVIFVEIFLIWLWGS